MKALVIYDSQFGNTEQIAKAIGEGIGAEAQVVNIAQANPADLAFYNLIIIGAPTQGGRYRPQMAAFLDSIPTDAFKNKKVAAFDTRLKGWVKIFGWAAPRIEKILKENGGNIITPAAGFIVKGAKGPLVEGELERAAAWAKDIAPK